MQRAALRRIALLPLIPRGPGGEEIQAQAKAGLKNAPVSALLPGRRQAAAAEKHRARLRQRTGARVVHVAIARAIGLAVGLPLKRLLHVRVISRGCLDCHSELHDACVPIKCQSTSYHFIGVFVDWKCEAGDAPCEI